MTSTIWTIGHSTRPIVDFLALLKAHDIRRLVDVRTVPRSRYNPQFNGAGLGEALQRAGIEYQHAQGLGGLRKPKKDSINLGWHNASFRGYADYMQTEDFWNSLQELMNSAGNQTTAIMCAEAVPWRCHRSLIADALVSRGWSVRHIMTSTVADPHSLTAFAKQTRDTLIYPAQEEEQAPRLF